MSTTFHLPYGYKGAPSWPSLYWPFNGDFDPLHLVADIPNSLYHIKDIWQFTVVWCLLFSLLVYLPAGIWAFGMLTKSRTLHWYIALWIPFLFVLCGSIASFLIGSTIGIALAFIYNSGFFVMSTWIPFLWALIHILIVVIGSYSTITAIL